MFDTVLIVDWSGGNDRGTRPKKDAIWTGIARAGLAEDPVYHRNRQLAEDWIIQFLAAEMAAGRRVLAGFDFAFGYPAGFGRVLTGSDDPFAIWDWFAAHVQDSPQANNRFDLAGQINARFPGIGPFWGNGLARDIPDLPRKGLARQGHGLPEKRAAEQQAKGAFAVWQLAGAGAVGSQVIMGLPVLARLRHRFGADLAVWPFQPLTPPIALVEVWPSLIAKTIAASCPQGAIKDAHQVRVLARALSALAPADLARMLDLPATAEGTILGLDHVPLLEQAVSAPVLRNDCFALPQGVHWTPVDQALAHLRQHLPPVAGVQPQPLAAAAGRYLAQDVSALRAHPPSPNAAVDGYGFAGPAVTGAQSLTLVQGRAAAGQPFAGVVPAGHAIRILTGANLPQGVDTVVMQEDVQATDTAITFQGPLKRGANARAAGEDMTAGQIIARQGRRLTPADLGMCAAAGIGDVHVYRPLRVGILSTGDELRDPGSAIAEGQIFDANRPMLAALVRQWGHDAVDLGRAPDDRQHPARDTGSGRCDLRCDPDLWRGLGRGRRPYVRLAGWHGVAGALAGGDETGAAFGHGRLGRQAGAGPARQSGCGDGLRAGLCASGTGRDGGRQLAGTAGIHPARRLCQDQKGRAARISARADQGWQGRGFRLGRIGAGQRAGLGRRAGHAARRSHDDQPRRSGHLYPL